MKFLDDRQTDRFEVTDGEVTVKVLFTRSQDLREVQAKVTDIGLGGLCLAPGVELEEGALADLKIRLDGITIRDATGLVRWCDEEKGVGVEFFYGSDEERERLHRHLADWIETFKARKKEERAS